MTKFERVFPIFGVIFAVVYTYAVYNDIAFVTYHPKIGVWDIGRTASRDGPAMYWYGFVLAAFVVSVPLAALCTLIPEKILQKGLSLTWMVPVVSIGSFLWLLLPYYTKH
jgi:hypothetical protein